MTGSGTHPDLSAHDALGLATDAELAGHVNGSDPHVLYALDADLANHEADATAIHGIANTASLVVTTDSRLSDPRTPTAHAHLDADLPTGIARDAEVSSAVATHAATSHGVPAGVIVMWGGLVASIPSGWALCNGANGTPDLRDRFVKGAAAEPGTTGGAATHNHAAHVVTQPAAHAAHAALATHAHELPFSKATGGTGALKMLAQSIFGSGTSRAPESISAAPTANTVAATVALSQAVSAGTPDAHSAHTGTAVDAHTAASSEPAYYALAFIQKL